MITSFFQRNRLFIYTTLLYFSTIGCAGPRYTLTEACEDIVFIKNKIDSIHPNPYYSTSRNNFEQTIDSLIRSIADDKKLTQKELFLLLNPIIASLNDGHTRLIVPNNITFKSFFWGSKVLPLDLLIENDRMYVKNNLDNVSIELGSEISHINEIPIGKLIQTIKMNKYGDNDSMRIYAIDNKSFPKDLWLYHGFNKHFSLQYITADGKDKKGSVKGIYQPSFYHKLGKLKEKEPTKLINGENGYYYEIPNDSLAIVHYSYFGGDRDSSFFHDVFANAKRQGIKHLFLDLRGNGGGSTNTYKHIISYLSQDTLSVFAKAEYKVSKELLDQKIFGNDFQYALDQIGLIVSIPESFLNVVPYKTDIHYDGKFYCISDAGTFSTASSFCAFVKDNQLGLLVGKSTGGSGTSFGNYVSIQLPNSKLKCIISTTKYYRGNGNFCVVPVTPDVYVPFLGADVREILKLINHEAL